VIFRRVIFRCGARKKRGVREIWIFAMAIRRDTRIYIAERKQTKGGRLKFVRDAKCQQSSVLPYKMVRFCFRGTDAFGRRDPGFISGDAQPDVSPMIAERKRMTIDRNPIRLYVLRSLRESIARERTNRTDEFLVYREHCSPYRTLDRDAYE